MHGIPECSDLVEVCSSSVFVKFCKTHLTSYFGIDVEFRNTNVSEFV